MSNTYSITIELSEDIGENEAREIMQEIISTLDGEDGIMNIQLWQPMRMIERKEL